MCVGYIFKKKSKTPYKFLEVILASHDFFRTKSVKNSAGANTSGANICPKTAGELKYLRRIPICVNRNANGRMDGHVG